jgi:hypothetical protein
MPAFQALAAPAALLAVFLYVVLIGAYKAASSARHTLFMRSLAHELALSYNQPIVLRPPSLGGVYRGREVAVDFVGEFLRVRAFHRGEIADEFTVGTEEYLKMAGEGPGIRPGTGNPDFEGAYRMSGRDVARARRYLERGLGERMMEAGLSVRVGRHDVSYMVPGRPVDRGLIVRALDFLAEAAARADRL